jgi:uroporphyrinogen decarboxylase
MTDTPSPRADCRFLRAARRQPVDCTPLWFMRQAGRCLPEYRELRAKHSMLESCYTPELAAQITAMPFNHYQVDAAVLFSDLLVQLPAMGLELEYVPGVGPQVGPPIRGAEDLKRLRDDEAGEKLAWMGPVVQAAREAIPADVPLLGFVGAPFTVGAYAIEGGPSKNFEHVKHLIQAEPETWHRFATLLTDVTAGLIRLQVASGAEAIQIFDSWAGALSPQDYREACLPYTKQLVQAAQETGVPVINFGTGTAGLLELLSEAGPDVVGLDWRVDLDAGWERVGFDKAVQGNLDPMTTRLPWEALEPRAKDVLRRAGNRDGHIFNLGHGVFPETKVENLQKLVELVHTETAR